MWHGNVVTQLTITPEPARTNVPPTLNRVPEPGKVVRVRTRTYLVGSVEKHPGYRSYRSAVTMPSTTSPAVRPDLVEALRLELLHPDNKHPARELLPDNFRRLL